MKSYFQVVGICLNLNKVLELITFRLVFGLPASARRPSFGVFIVLFKVRLELLNTSHTHRLNCGLKCQQNIALINCRKINMSQSVTIMEPVHNFS